MLDREPNTISDDDVVKSSVGCTKGTNFLIIR